MVNLHVCFTFAANVRIFFRNSRFLGGVFLGCAQESRCGRWRGVSFCRVCHPRCYWRRCTQRLYNAPACAHSPVIPASEPESWVALCGRVRGRCRHCQRHRLAHGCRLGGRHDGARGRAGQKAVCAPVLLRRLCSSALPHRNSTMSCRT